jgi:hypothetical protein
MLALWFMYFFGAGPSSQLHSRNSLAELHSVKREVPRSILPSDEIASLKAELKTVKASLAKARENSLIQVIKI